MDYSRRDIPTAETTTTTITKPKKKSKLNSKEKVQDQPLKITASAISSKTTAMIPFQKVAM